MCVEKQQHFGLVRKFEGKNLNISKVPLEDPIKVYSEYAPGKSCQYYIQFLENYGNLRWKSTLDAKSI